MDLSQLTKPLSKPQMAIPLLPPALVKQVSGRYFLILYLFETEEDMTFLKRRKNCGSYFPGIATDKQERKESTTKEVLISQLRSLATQRS